MMKQVVLIWFIVGCGGALTAADQPNLIEELNPGFEGMQAQDPTQPEMWRLIQAGGRASIVEENPHSGKRCLCLEAIDPMKSPACALPPVPVKPRTVYKLTFWARAEAAPGGITKGLVNVSFHYLDKDEKSLPLAGEYYGRIQVAPRLPAGEWTQYSGVMMAPAPARFGRINIQCWRNVGRAWFDDFVVQEDPAASVMVELPGKSGKRVQFFDFGRTGAALWPGFADVSDTTAYSREKGYGWMRADGTALRLDEARGRLGGLRGLIERSRIEPQRPDALSGDCIHVQGGSAMFACDIPNETYRVEMCIEGYGRRDWEQPDESYEVTAEGEQKISFQMTQQKMLSEDYLYKWWNHDFDPSEDGWATYIKPLDRIRIFDVEVKDGQLNMTMPNALVKYVLIYPPSMMDAVAAEKKRLDAGRRESFYFVNYSYEEPEDPNPVPKPSEQDEKCGFILFARHYLDLVNPASRPAPDEMDARELSIFAAPGEYEPVTFTVYPIRKIDRFVVSASDLKDQAGHRITSNEIDVRYVRWRPRSSRDKSGRWEPWPECLIPSKDMSLKPGLNCRFWLTVHVPQNAAPGNYEGAITLGSDSGPERRIPLKVRVVPFKLADLEEKYSWSYYTYPPQRLALNMDTRRALAKAFCEELKKHSMTSIQLPAPDIRNMKDVDTYELDFTDFDMMMGAALEAGLTGEKQVHTHGANIYYFRRYGGGDFTPDYCRGYKNYLTRIRDHCKEKGWETPLIWTVDEPRESDTHRPGVNRGLEATMEIDRLAREVPGIRVTVTPMQDTGQGLDYTPLLDTLDVMQTHAWRFSERLIDGCRKSGKPWWSYNSGRSRYSWGIECCLLDAVGRWQWHYNSWPKFPHNPLAYGRSYAVIYPSPHGLVPTVAFEVAREGADDYRYIHTLIVAVDKTKKAGRDASKAEALLKEIKGLPPFAGRDAGGNAVGGFAATLFEKSSEYDTLRLRIAEQIVQLQG